MSLPAIKTLKNEFPGEKIIILTKEYLKDIFKNIKEISEVITIPDHSGIKNFFIARKKIKKYKFKTGVLLTNSFQSALLLKLSGVGNLIGFKKEGRGFLLKKKIKFPSGKIHYVQFCTQIVNLLTGKNKETITYLLRPRFEPEEKETVMLKLKNQGITSTGKLIGITPGAAYGPAKEWQENKFAALIDLIHAENDQMQILMLGNSKEKTRINSIINLNKKAGVYNLAGKLTLREAMISVSFCNAFICNDSGFMHIAASLDIPTVAIFGPTLPERSRPLNQRSRVINKFTDCAPCLHRICPTDHRCMELIQAVDVFKALKSLINIK